MFKRAFGGYSAVGAAGFGPFVLSFPTNRRPSRFRRPGPRPERSFFVCLQGFRGVFARIRTTDEHFLPVRLRVPPPRMRQDTGADALGENAVSAGTGTEGREAESLRRCRHRMGREMLFAVKALFLIVTFTPNIYRKTYIKVYYEIKYK